MASTWTIRVNDRSYGPYTLDQMRVFASEGRLAPQSLVAVGTGTDWRPAADDAALATLFRASIGLQAPPQPVQRPIFFTAEGDIGRMSERQDAQASPISRFLIVADMKSRSIAGLEEEIYRCGQEVMLMPQAWLLASEMTVNALRNTLIQKLGRIDMLFIVDASCNKAAWFGFGPEADSRIRRVWQKAHELQNAD